MLYRHTPVLANEVIELLNPKNGELYLDLTFGAGGHTKMLLDKAQCNVIAFDRDPVVAEYASVVESDRKYTKRFRFINDNFIYFAKHLADLNVEGVDGILLDLGFSSMQVDDYKRGFSFMNDGPLDMRMGTGVGISADEFVNNAKEEELYYVIKNFGEEPFAHRIASHIVRQRKLEPISTTKRLAEIVRMAIGRKFGYSRIDPSTKTFQAIRIHVNNELENLQSVLSLVSKFLNKDGRLVVISFHGLEDGIVKRYLKRNALIRDKKTKAVIEGIYAIATKKPIIPSDFELKSNRRSRSAKLRCGIKVL